MTTDSTEKKPIKILVVEDEDNQMLTVCQALVHEGYSVLQAFTAQDGFVMAMSHEPALIIADKLIPGSNGIDLVQRIRQNPRLAKIPVLFFSNVEISGPEEEKKIAAVQPAEYLLKSDVALKDIVEKVKILLQN
jgi:DNA-binding response OmpR family regulator